jgi:hypothetical protein
MSKRPTKDDHLNDLACEVRRLSIALVEERAERQRWYWLAHLNLLEPREPRGRGAEVIRMREAKG